MVLVCISMLSSAAATATGVNSDSVERTFGEMCRDKIVSESFGDRVLLECFVMYDYARKVYVKRELEQSQRVCLSEDEIQLPLRQAPLHHWKVNRFFLHAKYHRGLRCTAEFVLMGELLTEERTWK